MLEKTMRRVITKKVEAWLNTIGDPEIVTVIKKDLILMGGCFTSMIQNEKPKDFDCYFRSKETVVAVAKYYVNLWNTAHEEQHNKIGKQTKVFVLDGGNPDPELLEYYHVKSPSESASRMIANTPAERVKIIFPSDGIVGDPEEVRSSEELGTAEENLEETDEEPAEIVEQREKRTYFPVFLSTNAITLSDGIQIVIRFYGEPKEIHETYDFVHTKSFYDFSQKELSIPREVYEAVVNKTLIYTGSRYPVCSVFRTRKFIARGWKINAGQLLKMCLQISQLDLMDIDVLEDQLIGVDSLYFMQLISQFRRQREEDPKFELTSTYVISIVDKIF